MSTIKLYVEQRANRAVHYLNTYWTLSFAGHWYLLAPTCINCSVMKVKKNAPVKEHTKSQKWKDIKGKRGRIPVTSSEVNSTPVMIRMIKEHQISVKKKPSVKRLKNKAKSAVESTKNSHQNEPKKPQSQTNGDSVFAVESGSDDVAEWREYSQSVKFNKMEMSRAPEEIRSGRLEGESLHHCAERDDQKNHAVLVMQKDQVQFSCFFFFVMVWQLLNHQSMSFTLFLWLSFRPCVSVGNAFWLVYMVE